MSAFSKPDKCAILQETVNTIQQISKEEIGSREAVQQSQVSSSKPSLLANDLLGPLLLEALDGFLFLVNSQGKVEFVSENVKEYLNYNQDELVGKSIYNIIHVGDHAKFSNNLLPMSLGNNLRFSDEEYDFNKAKNFSCRMLIKPPCDVENDIEHKQPHVWQYESMQITAVLQPHLGEKFSETFRESEKQTCLVCISRRLPLAEKANMMIGIEQFTTKQDLSGKILAYDSRGLANNHRIALDFVGQTIHEFCHANDIQQFNKHFQEVKKNGSNTSGIYRFKLLEGKYVFVQTKSRLFSNSVSNEAEFIMSTHSIIRECDSEVELKGSASTSLMKSIIGPSGTSARSNMSTTATASASLSVNGGGGQTNFMSPQTSSGKVSIGDSLSVFDNWDSMFGSDSSSSDLLNTLSNVSTCTTSPKTSWAQGVANVSKLSPNTSLMPGNTSAINSNKKPPALNFTHRNNSLSFEGQTSPGFPTSPGARNSGFQVPSSLISSYQTQKSPGTSGQLRGQYTAQLKKSNSLMSPPPSATPTVGSSTWGRSLSQEFQSVSSSVSPHRSIEHSLSSEMPSRFSSEKLNFDNGDRGSTKTGKLCQLLTQNTSFQKTNALFNPPKLARTDSSVSSRSVKERLDFSPFENISQSPTPGTALSSPEKPQSTSNEDCDVMSSKIKDEKKDNLILKKLLSQDDDSDVPSIMDQEVTSSPHSSSINDINEANLDLGRNEAEAKKPANVILKQLLNEDSPSDGATLAGQDSDMDDKKLSSELLQKLLQEEESNQAVPGETTIREADSGSRSRHQSGHQDPQPSSSSQCIPQSQQNNSTFDDSILKMFSNSAKKGNTDINILQNKSLDNLLNSLWERDTATRDSEVKLRVQKKRKASFSNVDSTDMCDTEPSQSRLSQKNALLTQLLSKKAAKESMVLSTQQTVKPTLVPQSRLPKNIIERIILVKSSENKEKESSNVPTSRDNPTTNPNIPFPGNTKQNVPANESSQDSFLNSNYDSESNQLDTIQQLLNQSESMDTENTYGSDPLLQCILQQAADLEQDINNSQQNNQEQQQQQQQQQQQLQQQQQQSIQRPPTSSQQPNVNITSNTQPVQQQQQTVASKSGNDVGQMDDATLISQLEQLIGDSNNWAEIDHLLSGNVQNPPAYNSQDASDQMAINAIQRQLMGEEVSSVSSNFPSTPQHQSNSHMSDLINRQLANQTRMTSTNVRAPVSQISTNMDGQFNQPQLPTRPVLQSNFNPSLQGNVSIGQQGQRFTQPQGLPSPTSRQMFRGVNPSAMGAQVRQSLLQQQRQKQFERRQRLQLAERQRLLSQQMRPYGPRFQSGNLDSSQPPFPENLNELMNSGHAPNVTLPVQRGGQSLPSPQSPRYNTGNVQPPLSPMLPPSTPPSQLSPHFTTGSQQQWNMRTQPTSNMGSQYNIQRHRSLSGGNIPNTGINSSTRQTFNINDSHFGNNQPKLNMMNASGQNAQMYSRQMLQRQMSLPQGRGSPRAPQSPFGNSPDPMLLSPNNSVRPAPQQVSPTFSQSSISSAPFSSATSSFNHQSNSTTSNSQHQFSDFDLSFIDSAISGLEGKKTEVNNSTSQYVKQELRNICNARSEKQHQAQQLHLSTPDNSSSYDTGGELPLDILETINDMAKEHCSGLSEFDDTNNEDVVSQSRNEARKRYEQFRALSTPDQEDPAAKATSVFRNQLLTNPQQMKQAPIKPVGKLEQVTSVNIVQKEPRTPIEDIKPADQKNSLLQQLLSE